MTRDICLTCFPSVVPSGFIHFLLILTGFMHRSLPPYYKNIPLCISKGLPGKFSAPVLHTAFKYVKETNELWVGISKRLLVCTCTALQYV